MNEPIANNLTMPSPIDLVKQTVDSYSVDRSKSPLAGLAPATLLAVGLMLVDTSKTISDALAALYEDEGEDVCSRSAFYNFASDFRVRFDRVRKDHRARIARLTAGDITDGQLKSQTDLIKARLIGLLAERSVDVATLENLNTRDLNAMLQLTRMIDEGDRDNRALQLKAEDSERKQAKLEADLEEAQLKRDRLQQQIDEFTRKVEDTVRAASVGNNGPVLTPEVITEIRRAVLGR